MSERELDRGHAIDLIRERTPARLLVGRSGESYRTGTLLELRADHAAARDAVHASLNRAFLDRMRLVEVLTKAESKDDFLLRPDLGRRLCDDTRSQLATYPHAVDLQIIVGDGLSATAVEVQVPVLLPLIVSAAMERGWSTGTPFAIRHCRVGVLNEVGELLDPKVAVLLIGERPGLATSESLSAYMAFRPRPGHADAQRNLISNIHERGVNHHDAARRIMGLAEAMMHAQASGISLKETLALGRIATSRAASE